MPDLNKLRSALGDLSANWEHSRALASALGMTPIKNPINLAAGSNATATILSGRVSELYRVGEASAGGGATAGLYLAFADEWHQRSAAREPYRRKVARALVENQQQDGRWLCVLLDGARQFGEAEFILPRRREGSPPGTVRAFVNLRDPSRFHVELLAGLDTSGAANLAALSRRWNETFSVEVVTKRFHEEFRELRDHFVATLIKANPGHPRLQGLDPKKDLALLAFGTRQLGRLLFLWFLQQKRWLGGAPGNGSTTYLVDLIKRHGASDGDGFFNDVLATLFFDALGQPESSPRHRAAVTLLDRVPFLGGGLFRPDPFEEELFGYSGDNRTVRVAMPDAIFDPAKDRDGGRRTVFGFLGGYRFTTQESTPDDQSVDPDPELLGKVFENLYQEDDRHQTGAYYTPREIVHYMCRQSIDGYLADQVAVTRDTLDWLRAEAIDWTVSDRRLDPGTAEALHHALDNVTVLDPAVGSGAFLVGAMQEIVLLRRGLEQSQVSSDIDPASLEVADWKRRAISQGLHGVDINPMAVEICKLRLWLSLVIDLELEEDGKPIALPDLDFRILAGDSLVDRMGAEPFIQSLPRPEFQPSMEILQAVNRLQHEIDSLKKRFSGEGVTPSEQRQFGQRIRKAETEIARVQLNDRIAHAEDVIASLARRERERAAGRNVPRVTQAEKRAAEAHLAGLRRLEQGLRDDAPFQKPFLWPVNFHEVMEKGGFDIVLANPPYVRQESLDAIDQESYGHTFKGVATGTADLYVYFYERAVQLLREGGHLAFITSNKYMRAAYGKGIREFLPGSLQLGQVIDFGDLPLFTVAAYPAVATGQKLAKPNQDAPVLVADMVYPVRRKLAAVDQAVNHVNVRQALEELPALLHDAAVAGYPQALLRKDGWILEDPALVRLFDRLMSQGTPLGEYVKGRMYYGIKTGLNEAFVIGQAKRDELVAADPKSAELIKRWLRGRDIKRWKAEWAGLYVIAIQNSGDADANNPWGKATSETEARAIFKAAYPAIHDHLSRFENEFLAANGKRKPGLRPRADQGKWWWELRACAYYREFEQPKVVWPRNVPPWECRFAFDASGSFINDKAYILAGLDEKWVGYLNSPLVFWLLDKLTTKLQGGWLELKSDAVVGRVPMPTQPVAGPSLDDETVNREVCRALAVEPQEEKGIWCWYAERRVYRGAELIEEADIDD